MAIGDLMDSVPDVGFSATNVLSALTYFVLIFIAGILAAVVTYILMRNKRFNKKVWVFEKVGARFEPRGSVRAMLTKLGESGDTVLFLKKYKKYLPTPSIQTGRDVYWFAIREDGEWINIGIEDVDEKSRELNVYFLDKEMRYARAALQKNLKDRHVKVTFLEKYGGLMVYAGFVLIIGVSVYLWFDKLIELTGSVDGVINSASIVMEKAEAVLGKVDNVCSGSGVRTG